MTFIDHACLQGQKCTTHSGSRLSFVLFHKEIDNYKGDKWGTLSKRSILYERKNMATKKKKYIFERLISAFLRNSYLG